MAIAAQKVLEKASSYIGVKNGANYGTDITINCNGNYQCVEIPTADIDVGTDITVYDKGANFATYNDTLSYDCIL